MSDIRALYQELILDHNKNPRNFRVLSEANRLAEGHNPLCGDRFSVFVKVDGDKIAEMGFQGMGCAISKASASLMTTAVKDKTISEANALIEMFLKVVTGTKVIQNEGDEERLGKLIVFSGVSEFPVRVKCASLAWRTLQAALEQKKAPISTE